MKKVILLITISAVAVCSVLVAQQTRTEVTKKPFHVARFVGEACARAFDRLMERNVINFPSGSATIDPSSRRLLDALASVALRCDRFTIEVAGHTDNSGAPDMNMQLSQARADAVAAYLGEQGVARPRLTARGYGSARPRADNATAAGQAANRRIEFNVSG